MRQIKAVRKACVAHINWWWQHTGLPTLAQQLWPTTGPSSISALARRWLHMMGPLCRPVLARRRTSVACWLGDEPSARCRALVPMTMASVLSGFIDRPLRSSQCCTASWKGFNISEKDPSYSWTHPSPWMEKYVMLNTFFRNESSCTGRQLLLCNTFLDCMVILHISTAYFLHC